MKRLIHDNGRMGSKESLDRARSMTPRETDVFIVTYPKSGTTWMQQILFQIVSGGSMEFGEICEVVPWIEHAHYLGQDIESMSHPRIFKTHFDYASVPKGRCRYIYILRDGRDVAVSFYYFLKGMTTEECPFRDFFMDFFMAGKSQSGSWFAHVKEWWRHREEENVLILTYESMKEDLAGAVATVAKFCGFNLSRELSRLVVERSDFQFMKQHERQFDDHFVRDRVVANAGIGTWATKVRQGNRGSHRGLFGPDLDVIFEAEFERQMEELGIRRYEDFEVNLRRRAGL